MTKRILIIHGWESSSREHFFLEEKSRLEKLGFEVFVPDMSNTFHPVKQEWVDSIKDFHPDQDSILIGHSLGGAAILRYLEQANGLISKCILIAAPIRKIRMDKLDFSAIDNFLEPEFVWEKIKNNCKNIIILNQKEDPYVKLGQGEELARMTDGKLYVVEGNNHFDTIDFSFLEQLIQN